MKRNRIALLNELNDLLIEDNFEMISEKVLNEKNDPLFSSYRIFCLYALQTLTKNEVLYYKMILHHSNLKNETLLGLIDSAAEISEVKEALLQFIDSNHDFENRPNSFLKDNLD